MAYEQKPGDIALFPNEDKTPDDKRPSMKGYLIAKNGEKIQISVWTRTSANGKKFLSGGIDKQQEEKPATSGRPAPPPTPKQDDDLPF